MAEKRPRSAPGRPPAQPPLVNVQRRQQALRENLKRRKEQARAREDGPAPEDRKTLIRRDPA